MPLPAWMFAAAVVPSCCAAAIPLPFVARMGA
jgi:hypothetical protein